MAKSKYVFESGTAIDVGNHGDHSYVFESGSAVADNDESGYVFETGTGLRGTAGAIIDSFEDGDIDEYGGNTGAFTVVDESTLSFSAKDGSKVLHADYSGSFEGIHSTSGLDNYFDTGQEMRAWFRVLNFSDRPNLRWFAQSQNNDADSYRAQLNGTGELRLLLRSGGNNSELDSDTSLSVGLDEWHEYKVTHTASGDIDVDVLDENGNVVGSVSANDTTFSDGGHGWSINSNAGDSDIYFDHARTV